MTREIKFRAWVTPDERWFIEKGPHMIGPETLKQMMDSKMTAFYGTWTWHCLTIMQYTGLKEIYEHDLITACYGRRKTPFSGTVKWDNDALQWIVTNKSDWMELGRLDDIEVVGNIYENPTTAQ